MNIINKLKKKIACLIVKLIICLHMIMHTYCSENKTTNIFSNQSYKNIVTSLGPIVGIILPIYITNIIKEYYKKKIKLEYIQDLIIKKEIYSKYNIDIQEKKYMEILEEVKSKYYNKNITVKDAILMYGPPGNGKNHIVEDIAFKNGYKLIRISFNDIYTNPVFKPEELFKSLHNYFVKNKNINFILELEEIDLMVPICNDHSLMQMKEKRYLNILLNNIPLFNQLNNVIVIANTNSSLKQFHPALIRNGRFGKQIYINNPNEKDIFLITKSILTKKKILNLDINNDYNYFINNLSKMLTKKLSNKSYSTATILSIIEKKVLPVIESSIDENYTDESYAKIINKINELFSSEDHTKNYEFSIFIVNS